MSASLKMAHLHAQGRRRHRARQDWWGEAKTGRQVEDERDAMRRALRELHEGGVNVDRAPKDAVEMVVDANLPVLGAAFRARGRRR